jgi:hypothetical protein
MDNPIVSDSATSSRDGWDTEDVFAVAENLVTITLNCIPFTFNGMGNYPFGIAKRSPAVSVGSGIVSTLLAVLSAPNFRPRC